MGNKIFISYCHAQKEWVYDNLQPILQANGAEVLIDRETFGAGKALVGQMDNLQDQAEYQILVFSPEYLASKNCLHEMKRAVQSDPTFSKGVLIPLIRVNCQLPDSVLNPNPLYVDLTDDRNAEQWNKLLKAFGYNMNVEVTHWLQIRNEIRQALFGQLSVNMVVNGKAEWRQLIDHLKEADFPNLVCVDLENGSTASRRGLIGEILNKTGARKPVPKEPEDLVVFSNLVQSYSQPLFLCLLHFDMVNHRKQYEVDIYGALRYLIMDARKLVLLIHSKTPFTELLPEGHPLSSINSLRVIELMGRR